MAEHAAVSNERTMRCVLVGTHRKTFVAVPRVSNKMRFFEIDFAAEKNTYEPSCVVFATSSKRPKNVAASHLYKHLSKLSEDEFEGLDMLHATLTVVDFVPDFLEFIVSEAQGPALKRVDVLSTTRTDELRILRELGFAGGRVFGHDVAVASSDFSLEASIPLKTPEMAEDARRSIISTYETSIVKKFEALVAEDRVAREFDLEKVVVDVTLGVRELRDFVVLSATLRVGDDERVPAGKTLASLVSKFESMVTGVPKTRKPRTQKRKRDEDPTKDFEPFLDEMQQLLFGPTRVVDASIFVASRAILAHSELDEDDAALLRSLKMKAPSNEGYDPKFVKAAHAFVLNPRARLLLTDFFSDDAELAAAFQNRVDEFLESFGKNDEAALLEFQLSEMAAARRDRVHLLPLRKVFRAMKRAIIGDT